MGKSTPQIQPRWRVCPHRSTAGCCPMGMSIGLIRSGAAVGVAEEELALVGRFMSWHWRACVALSRTIRQSQKRGW